MEWLGSSLEHLDHSNRELMDGVVLRQCQGAAQVLAEFIDHVHGKAGKAALNTREGST